MSQRIAWTVVAGSKGGDMRGCLTFAEAVETAKAVMRERNYPASMVPVPIMGNGVIVAVVTDDANGLTLYRLLPDRCEDA